MGSKRRSKESVHKARKYNTTVLYTNLTCVAIGQKNLSQSWRTGGLWERDDALASDGVRVWCFTPVFARKRGPIGPPSGDRTADNGRLAVAGSGLLGSDKLFDTEEGSVGNEGRRLSMIGGVIERVLGIDGRRRIGVVDLDDCNSLVEGPALAGVVDVDGARRE